MGIDTSFGVAFAKSQMSSNNVFPTAGTAFISVNNRDKRGGILLARSLEEMGFRILATMGTATALERNGVPVERVRKVGEEHPNIADLIREGKVDLVINTPFGRGARGDGYNIRTEATMSGVPCITTMQAAFSVVQGIAALRRNDISVKSIQEYHAEIEEDIKAPADGGGGLAR